MLSNTVTMIIFAAVALVLIGLFQLIPAVRRKGGRIRTLTFAVPFGIAMLVYAGLANRVYILDDALPERYESKVALFSTGLTLKNGEMVQVEPRWGWKNAVIINNNESKHQYERVAYGNAKFNGQRVQTLKPYTATYLTRSSVDYIYRNAPSTIRTKNSSGEVKGVIR